MELWKVLLLTYLSVIVIEGVPSMNFVSEDGGAYEDDLDASVRDTGPAHVSLFQRWKERRKSTISPPISTSTLAPGSLADLNLRIKALEDQVTNLYNAILLEEQQIAAMASQITAMSATLNAVYNAVINASG